jgi:hypothetical protein
MQTYVKKAITFIFLSLIVLQQIAASFSQETLVLTPLGLKQISEIKKNETVVGYNPDNGSFVDISVTSIEKINVNQSHTIQTTSNTIHASADQQFYDACADEFIQAQYLQTKDKLLTSGQTEIACLQISPYSSATTMYELSLESPHLFFISNECILVHNFVPALPWQELGRNILSRSDPLVKLFIEEEDKKAFDQLRSYLKSLPSHKTNAILNKNLWLIEEERQLKNCGYNPWEFKNQLFGLRSLRCMINKKISPWAVLHTLSCGTYKPAQDNHLLLCSSPNDNVTIVIEKCSHKVLNLGHFNTNSLDLDKPDETPSDIDQLNENKIKHIIEGSKKSNHQWEKLVPNKNWKDIKKIIKDVLRTGIEEPSGNAKKKTKTVDGNVIEVSYGSKNNTSKVGSAWIK